jgi:hypothetical protein
VDRGRRNVRKAPEASRGTPFSAEITYVVGKQPQPPEGEIAARP